ncbi:MAG: FtsW/RodA/SpoVE family cell cycle protein [Candidatus Paceibacterota bacterium]
MFKKIDWWLIGALIFMAAASLTSLSSTKPALFQVQLIWFILFFLIVFFAAKINWNWLISQNWFLLSFYWLMIILLAVTLLATRSVRGAHSWLILGPFRFQPSELAKISLILIFASFFSRRHLEVSLGKNIFISLFYFLIPAALVALQPALGMAIIFFGIWFSFLIVSGLKWQRILASFLIFILVFSVLWMTFLRPYQKERILGFIFPERNPLGTNYNVIQSKIAIGSAGLFGKGFRQGTQSQLGFLPEAQTDFIFSAFVEEWGLVGGFLLIAAFLLIIWRIITIGIKSEGNCAKFICLGAAIALASQFFFNIGSCLGLSPVVGITFPFLSYGGSSLLTNALLIGIIQNIAIESSF